MAKDEVELNPFIYSEVFKTPEASFLRRHKGLDAAIKKCLFVLDTNVLLVPFGVSPKSLSDIREIYGKLVTDKRVFIPKQCAREFLKNRPGKIRDLHEQINNALSKLPSIQEIPFVSLEGLGEHKNYLAEAEALKQRVKAYKKSLDKLWDAVKKWNYNDPISDLYSTVFTKDVFIDHKLTDEAVRKDCERRSNHSLPPGYKDRTKDDGGIGDVAIWQSILELGRLQKKDIVFVCNDEKPDWVVRAAGQTVSPRYELIDEFVVECGCEFYLTTFAQFLHQQGAKAPTVTEVKDSTFADSLSAINTGSDIIIGATLIALGSALEDLEVLFESHVESCASDKNEYVYIRDDELLDAIDTTISILVSGAKDESFRATFRGQLRKLSANLERILHLNDTLKYIEVRMKESGGRETTEQLELCRSTLHLMRIIRGIVRRYAWAREL